MKQWRKLDFAVVEDIYFSKGSLKSLSDVND